jgi:hypothetical protein
MYYKQKTTLNLKIRAENPGNYTIPLPINSTITYFIVGNGTYREQIPSTNLLVKFHQSGNDGNEDSNYIQISQPLKFEEANELFGKSSQSNDIAVPA